MPSAWTRHRLTNRLQTLALVGVMLGICALAGQMLLGRMGLWLALVFGTAALLLEPAAAARLTLRLYRAQPIAPQQAPQLWALLRKLAERASLPSVPQPYYVPSAVVNAFTIGNRRRAVIALTDGLLRTLTPRELTGVLAHEVAHIAHEDLRVLGLADYVSRLTGMFALAGQMMLLLALPWLATGLAQVYWPGLLLLAFSPQLAMLLQLGLSRVREFDADQTAAQLSGDPEGLALALAKIERSARNWRSWLLPGWGEAEPSWLRTHPPTAERIRRLRELAASMPPASALPSPGDYRPPMSPPRPARWHWGGFWH
ncbi:MAG: zinc metalloprotease HtpX [Burkholderiaceae bacterium]